MRLCAVARGRVIIRTGLVVGDAYLLEVRAPSWPVWPIEWRIVGELGFLVCVFAALLSAVIAAHCPDPTGLDP